MSSTKKFHRPPLMYLAIKLDGQWVKVKELSCYDTPASRAAMGHNMKLHLTKEQIKRAVVHRITYEVAETLLNREKDKV